MPKTGHQKAIITQTPDDLGPQQVNFNRNEFDAAITDKGYKVEIERALKCPCSVRGSGQALVNCGNCNGSGWFFIDKRSTMIFSTSLNNRNKHEVWADVNAGTVSMSLRPQDKVGFMDKVVYTELEMLHTEVLHLQLNSTGDKIFAFTSYKPVRVHHMYRFVDSDQGLDFVDAAEYTIRTNLIEFDFAIYGAMQDVAMTINYSTHPTYHVLDINRDLIKQKSVSEDLKEIQRTNFPIHCIGRLAHFIPEMADLNGESVYDNTNYSKTPTNYDV